MLSKYSKFYISVYLSLILTVFTILLNTFILVILYNKTFFRDNQNIYRYLRTNSYLNICFIIIFPVKLVKNCNDEDLFCSSIYDSIYVAYLNMILIKLIRNSLQTSSNLTQVSYTLSRYITVTLTKSHLLKLFDSVKCMNIFYL